MNEFYHSQFLNINFDEEKSLLKAIWFKDSQAMSEDNFREMLNHWVDGISHFKPKILLVDSRNFAFTIDPLIQTWMVEEVYPNYVENNVQKQAFLVSHDFFARISIVQTIEEVGEIITESQYFESEVKAMEWLEQPK